MKNFFKQMKNKAIDAQQSYFRRGARGNGNDKNGPRSHDVGLRKEPGGLLQQF